MLFLEKKNIKHIFPFIFCSFGLEYAKDYIHIYNDKEVDMVIYLQ